VSALIFAGACSKPSYLEVRVSFPTSPVNYAQEVQWIDLSAVDHFADAGPLRIPSAPVAAGLGADGGSLVVAVSAPAGAQVQVMVNGLDANGVPIASAGGSRVLSSGTSSIDLTLTPHCLSSRDCDPTEVCAGSAICSSDAPFGYGACVQVNGGILGEGAPCGPSNAGHCDGLGTCLVPDCGDGVLQAASGEQCDDGPGNSDLLPDHCRSDCQFPHCGDGVIDPDAGERCDLDAGNNGKGLGCNMTCTLLGSVTTLAGDGTYGLIDGVGASARFGEPYGLAVVGNALYVADRGTRTIRRLDLSTGVVQTLAGGRDAGSADGVGAAASFSNLQALFPIDGGILASDQASLRLVIPVANADAGIVTTYAGWTGDSGTAPTGFQAGSFVTAQYAMPYGIAEIGGVLYTNTHASDLLVASDPATQEVTEVSSFSSGVPLGGLASLARVVYTTNSGDPGSILASDTRDAGAVTTLASALPGPDGLCTDGRTLYVCMAGDRTVQQIDPLTGVLSLVAGRSGLAQRIDGLGADAGFVEPANCTWDPIAGVLYVSDRLGQTIRKIQ